MIKKIFFKRVICLILTFCIFSITIFPIKSYANPAVVAGSVVASQPELAVPLVAGVLVIGGCYVTYEAYDNYLKPYVLSKVKELGVDTLNDYFKTKYGDDGQAYITPTEDGRIWATNTAKDYYTSKTKTVKKTYIDSKVNDTEPFVDSEGYYTKALKVTDDNIYPSDKGTLNLTDVVFLKNGQTINFKVYNSANKLKSFLTYRATMDCNVVLRPWRLNTISGDMGCYIGFEYGQPGVYVDNLTGKGFFLKVYNYTESMYQNSMVYSGYNIVDTEDVQIPASPGIEGRTIDWDKVKVKIGDIAIPISRYDDIPDHKDNNDENNDNNEEPEPSSKPKFFPVITWTDELGDGEMIDNPNNSPYLRPTYVNTNELHDNVDTSSDSNTSTSTDTDSSGETSGESSGDETEGSANAQGNKWYFKIPILGNILKVLTQILTEIQNFFKTGEDISLDFTPLKVVTRKFPFSIPWDAWECFKVFEGSKSDFAYKFDSINYSNNETGQTITVIPSFEISFNEYPKLAVAVTVFKYLILLLFCFMLIKNTRTMFIRG